jgi:hypothetical protein
MVAPAQGRLEKDKVTQSGMLRNIGCKPFVGFALQARDTMKHPKRGPSFVSKTMVLLLNL